MATFAECVGDLIGEFRGMLPSESATARAIDEGQPWASIAMRAVDDGYIEFANELGSFIEICCAGVRGEGLNT